ncbi:MAG TPA: biotin-independent malonate decarboxylase subunit gamma, partial [Longimicrobiales bacterium]|nr:biotin-independent malonate decarboxylase subunit gamma [Longimicrobiales bacterium]
GLNVPTISVVIGEGGSGGALALGVTDRILMFENAVYSVITPEGCAAILWKTADARDQAAQALKVTAPDLRSLGVIDDVIPEPTGGAHSDWDAAADALGAALSHHLAELRELDVDALRARRWEKFDALGEWTVPDEAVS